MKCEEFREMLADDWAGTLGPEDRAKFEEHLAECKECWEERESLGRLWGDLGKIPTEEPGAESTRRFYAMLEGYGQEAAETQRAPSRKAPKREWFGLRLQPVFRFGLGAALVGLAFFSGYWIRGQKNGREEIATLRSEVHETRQLLTISLLNQQSASERLRGVSWSTQVNRPDPEFLTTLFDTLNEDPNVDVRLAAVDALARFASFPGVRQDLVKSLSGQDSPMVQISLIDLLVDLHERQSIEIFKQVVSDASKDPQVRERAQWGLQKLS